MDKKVVSELNAILKGEQMAVKSYERFIEDIDDENIRGEFIKIKEDHEKHIEQLSNRIKMLGGNAELGTGFAGVMASVKMTVEDLKNNKTSDILKKAYDGEDKGIAMVEEIIKGDLDSESESVVNEILSQDHEHLKKMAHILDNFEGENTNSSSPFIQ